MRDAYLSIAILVPWYSLAAVWLVTAFMAKRVARAEPRWQTWTRNLFMFAVFFFLYDSPPPLPWLHHRLVPHTERFILAGIALTYLGVVFAIWARLVLGRNWSGKVTIKRDHELIVRGPYRIVRNPIYTGIFFALLGTALAAGQLRHFLVLPVLLIVWAWKITREQYFLQEQFGEQYTRYRRAVKAFIPYVI